jgi:hypothetical protein
MTSFLSQICTKAVADDCATPGCGSDAIAQSERAHAEAEGRHFGRRMPASGPSAAKRNVAAAARVFAEPYFRHKELQPAPRDIVIRRPDINLARTLRWR